MWHQKQEWGTLWSKDMVRSLLYQNTCAQWIPQQLMKEHKHTKKKIFLHNCWNGKLSKAPTFSTAWRWLTKADSITFIPGTNNSAYSGIIQYCQWKRSWNEFSDPVRPGEMSFCIMNDVYWLHSCHRVT